MDMITAIVAGFVGIATLYIIVDDVRRHGASGPFQGLGTAWRWLRGPLRGGRMPGSDPEEVAVLRQEMAALRADFGRRRAAMLEERLNAQQEMHDQRLQREREAAAQPWSGFVSGVPDTFTSNAQTPTTVQFSLLGDAASWQGLTGYDANGVSDEQRCAEAVSRKKPKKQDWYELP